VNAEQASKRKMQGPTRRKIGEGRRRQREMTTARSGPAGVLAMACLQTEVECNTGSPGGDGA